MTIFVSAHGNIWFIPKFPPWALVLPAQTRTDIFPEVADHLSSPHLVIVFISRVHVQLPLLIRNVWCP